MAESKKSKANAEAARLQNASVGETLRAARVAKGLELEDVSSTIHVRSVQLKAIEEGNIDSLPGMTYAVGFVRSYANFLGLNGISIVQRFKAEHGHDAPPSKLSFPEPVVESRMPDPIMVGVGAFMAIIVLVLWTVYSNMSGGDSEIAEQIPPPPIVTTTAGIPAAPPAPELPLPDASAASAVVAAPPATLAPAAPPAAVTEPVPSPAAPAETVTAVPAAPAKTDVTSADEEDAAPPEIPAKASAAAEEQDEAVINIKRGKSRVMLQANQASWIQITDARQNVVYRKVLRPGEQYYVPDQPGLSLVTANAGGLDIIVDGKPVQSVGKPGEIVRGIVLDPAQLKQHRTKVRD